MSTRTQRRLPRRPRWLEDLGHRRDARLAARAAEQRDREIALRLADSRGLRGLAILRPDFTVAHVTHELLSTSTLEGGLVIGCQRCRTSVEISVAELLEAPADWAPTGPIFRA